MGYIAECRDAGIPEELLIPVQPPFLSLPIEDERRQKSGKFPAVPTATGDWIPMEGWEKLDTPWRVKKDADDAGANCGLILGCSDKAGTVAFAAVDIDLYEGQEQERDKLLNNFASVWPDATVLVR